MINVGIIGATGYAGEELIDILLGHPKVAITALSAIIDKPREIADIFPKFKNRINLICKHPDLAELSAKCDLVFLALPHTVSMEMVPKLLKNNKKVIDLSADYRLQNTKVYEEFYKTSHKDKPNMAVAVYGLPELYRQKIKGADLIANPGCYPTAAILGLAPVVALESVDLNSLIIDAKSGASGAGRKLDQELTFSQVHDDFKAYKVNCHQHAPEIDQELSKLSGEKVKVVFVPHLLPLKRGILETIYLKKDAKKSMDTEKLINLYKKFYKNEPFVRVKEAGVFPGLKDVVNTNFCDIGIKVSQDNIIIVAAIDNLLKGAAGQAVQNLNIIYNFQETTALL
jgi:N-acetyl-gamma-glutamyl-phosphate reductase